MVAIYFFIGCDLFRSGLHETKLKLSSGGTTPVGLPRLLQWETCSRLADLAHKLAVRLLCPGFVVTKVTQLRVEIIPEFEQDSDESLTYRLHFVTMNLVARGILFLALAAGIGAVRTMIPTTSFNSPSDFDADWGYNYPWGTDHNGGARMSEDQVGFSNGVLTLTAKKVTGQPDAVSGGQNIAINYLSGAIHAKEHFNVSRGGGYDFTGEFKATTTKGTWPAFWLTGVDSWPPEIDMAEWKGSGKISFNTFNTSSILSWKDVAYPDSDQFHSIKCEVRDINQKDVSVKFYMDGSLVTTQVGGDFFGKPIIINLQMEGSSGSPGPSDVRVPSSISRKRAKAISRPSSFTNTALPRAALFEKPGFLTSVVRASRASRASSSRNVRFFLINQPKPHIPESPHRDPLSGFLGKRMLNFVQIATAPTADTPGTALLLHFDNKRYILGQIGEGTQRAFTQRKISVAKTESIFLTGPVTWRTSGGLLGLILTVADVLTSQANDPTNEARRKRKTSSTSAEASPSLNVHAGKNLSHFLAVSRRFIMRKGLPLRIHEVLDDPVRTDPSAPKPDWQDENINVWYMLLEPNQNNPATKPRKRSHDEFTNETAPSPSASKPEADEDIVKTVLTQMFDSNWTIDALVETTLHQVKPPATLFVRDKDGHLQVYTGPMPGAGTEVPDIPVFVRKPWPGALYPKLPRTQPSKQSMCYIVKGHDRRGRFNPEAALKLGVAKPDFKVLADMKSVKVADGTMVTPEMVLGETVSGTGFAVVDLPDVSYIDALVGRTEWSDSRLIKGVYIIFWILGRDVVNDTRLQKFMRKMSTVKHIVTSPDSCPNMLALESPATQAYKLRCIDADRFPLPSYSNEVSLTGAAIAKSPAYEIGRVGKTIQFAPDYKHQNDKIVSFPNIPKLARFGMSNAILQMAAKAGKKVSSPGFIARIEKAEADIPNRDAEIITLGTGSAMPSKYRNVSATLVRVPGYGNYLLDAGENTMGQLKRVFGHELPSVLRDLKVIWISHLHADHHLGTISVIQAWHEETMKSNPSSKLMIASHSHMIAFLQEYADIEAFGFERLVFTQFDKIDGQSPPSQIRVFSGEEAKEFGLQSIEICWVNHCYAAMATALTLPSGLKIAYSGDCRPSDKFVRIGKGATVLIHEATFEDELQGDAIAKKHSTISEAIDVGRRMGARRILLTHFSQRYQKIPITEDELDVRSDAETGKKTDMDEVLLVAFDYMRVKLGDFGKARAFLPTIQKLLENAEP
ncbi:hypothetical protein F4861DRAFT_540754 [Xylaria intraflava]|nr:hypothetical protein F4861DRAFT_540754 [Xylaria intraflava]